VGYSRCNGRWRESRFGVQPAGTRVSLRLPSMAPAAALTEAWPARTGRGAAALNRRATPCRGAKRWTAPWYGASGRCVRESSRRSGGSSGARPASPTRCTARRATRGGGLRGGLGARNGLGKVCAGKGAEVAGGPRRSLARACGGTAPALTARRVTRVRRGLPENVELALVD
jgi:hypothetical protein